MTHAQEPPLERLRIPVGDMVFDARAAGPRAGPVVLLLHGFPQTSFAFRHQIRALAAQGFRAVAPDQRGYSPGARPTEVSAYAVSNLVGDVMALADALGARQFHLVGHDWGGAVAWVAATRHADRVLSLTVLSTPHYAALSAELAKSGSDQAARSAYFSVFAAPGAEQRFLADDAAFLRSIYGDLDAESVDESLRVLGSPDALRAALAWYGAAFGPGSSTTAPPPGATTPVTVPTLYIWSTEDRAFGREAAEATAEHVSGPFRFEVIDDVDHWVAERVPQVVNAWVLEHIRGVVGGR